MDEYQALRVNPEESSESVHKPEQAQPQVPPPVAYPIIQKFVQMMRTMGQPPACNIVYETYEKIRKQGAKAFAGTTSHVVAEEWLRSTERILDRFKCTFEKKVSYVVSLFEQDALDYWEMVPGSNNISMTLTQEDFLKKFTEKYTPAVYQNRMKIEFLELKQNDLSVVEYEVQFVQLFKYTLQEVATNELKRNKFKRGLNLEIHEKMEIKPSTYREVLETVL